MKSKWTQLFLCFLWPLLLFSNAFAHSNEVNVEVTEKVPLRFSKPMLVSDHDVLIWQLENRSQDSDLTYAIYPALVEECTKVVPVTNGIVKPGQFLRGSHLGVNLTNPSYSIMIFGEKGKAQLLLR